MKAISLWQPYASLIPTGAKKIETRSWSTKYRGPLAIHAARTWNVDLAALLGDWRFQGGLAPLVGKPLDLTARTWPGIKKEQLPFGCIIATCELADCIPTGDMTLGQIGTDRPFGDFSLGRYAWILVNVRRIEPVPATGRQGLWEWEGA